MPTSFMTIRLGNTSALATVLVLAAALAVPDIPGSAQNATGTRPELVPQAEMQVDIDPFIFSVQTPTGGTCLLTTSSYDGVAKWRNPTTGELLRTLQLASWPYIEAMTGLPVDTSLSPDGKILASAGTGSIIRLQDAWTGQLRREMPGGRGPLVFSPDGKLLLGHSREADGMAMLWRVKVWDAQTGQLLHTLKPRSISGYTYSLASDGRSLTLRTSEPGGKVDKTEIWDVLTGELTQTLPHSTGLMYPPGYRPFALTADRLAQMQKVTAQLMPMSTVTVLKNGKTIIADASRLWDLSTGHLMQTLPGQAHRVSAVVIAPDGQFMSSGGGDGYGYSGGARLCVWDVNSRKLLWNIGVNLDRSNGSAFADMGSFWTTSLAFSPDSKALAVSSAFEQAPLTLYNVRTGAALWQAQPGNKRGVLSTAFSPDGSIIASGEGNWNDSSGGISLWDAKRGQLLRTFKQDRFTQTVAFAPDGKLIASGRAISEGEKAASLWLENVTGGAVELWNVATGERLHELTEHQDVVQCLAFSHSGKLLASGSRDRTIRLWDASTGQLLHTLWGHAGNISSMAFTAHDKALVSASEDGTVKVWKVNDGQLAATLMCFTSRAAPVHQIRKTLKKTVLAVPPTQWLAFTTNGYYDASPSAEQFIRWRLGDQLFPAERYKSTYFHPALMRHLLQGF